MPFTFHTIFDISAYTIAIFAYLMCGRLLNTNERPIWYNLAIIAGMLIGGGLCARLAVQFEHGLPADFSQILTGMHSGGKSVVAGFLGGIAGTKIIKLLLPRSTYGSADKVIGDQVIVPFTLALIIGRIGCLLSGLGDNTHGMPTGLIWGYDYGDHILRHPTQLYEIVSMALICAGLLLFWKKLSRYGLRFQIFVFGFCLQRFIIEFFGIHPAPYSGITVYQLICLIGMIWSFFLFNPASQSIREAA
jgi:prolipoprotein diacylglyceryltransferase